MGDTSSPVGHGWVLLLSGMQVTQVCGNLGALSSRPLVMWSLSSRPLKGNLSLAMMGLAMMCNLLSSRPLKGNLSLSLKGNLSSLLSRVCLYGYD